MTDEMSVEAKERLFRKPRQFTQDQLEWLEKFGELSEQLPKERLLVAAIRTILLHLQLPGPDIANGVRRVGLKPLVDSAKKPLKPTQAFQWLIWRVPTAFPRDDVVKTKLRELAQSRGLTTQEIIASGRRLF